MREAHGLVPRDAHLLDERVGNRPRIASAHALEDGADVTPAFCLRTQCLAELLRSDHAVADQHLADLVVPFTAALVESGRTFAARRPSNQHLFLLFETLHAGGFKPARGAPASSPCRPGLRCGQSQASTK